MVIREALPPCFRPFGPPPPTSAGRSTLPATPCTLFSEAEPFKARFSHSWPSRAPPQRSESITWEGTCALTVWP
jgi:hypothetical protein